MSVTYIYICTHHNIIDAFYWVSRVKSDHDVRQLSRQVYIVHTILTSHMPYLYILGKQVERGRKIRTLRA